jgi:two-component system OmpR family response regulator
LTERILIIETEPSLREALTSTLTRAGFSVAHIARYLEALLWLDVFKPDMIILNLTSENSLEMCRQLHTAFHIPIILFGKDSSGVAWMKAVQAGADFYFDSVKHPGQSYDGLIQELINVWEEKKRDSKIEK